MFLKLAKEFARSSPAPSSKVRFIVALLLEKCAKTSFTVFRSFSRLSSRSCYLKLKTLAVFLLIKSFVSVEQAKQSCYIIVLLFYN